MKLNGFPIGRELQPDVFNRNPYPTLGLLRAHEPISWIPAFQMYYLTRHADVHRVLLDAETYAVGVEGMLVYDTFGRHMMTVDGAEQKRYRTALQSSFTPGAIRGQLEPRIGQLVGQLVAALPSDGVVDLRAGLASRLPIQTMLAVFGLPPADESLLRSWYDDFEAALANYTRDPVVRGSALASVAEFHAHLQRRLDALRARPDESLLSALVTAPAESRLEDDEIRRNALIIFFGGISTVEALILNTVHALATHPETLQRVAADPALLPVAIEETIRWRSPVQAVTRYVTRDTELLGIALQKGCLVNCMIGSANRDEAVFRDPDRFDIDRKDLRHHVGFAVGPHHCLGSRLAKAEARIAIAALLRRYGSLRLDAAASTEPSGYEFHQPSRLSLQC